MNERFKNMRLPAALLMCFVLAELPTLTMAQEAPADDFTLPAWRIGFSAYGDVYGLYLHRALGKRTDLGLRLDANLSSKNSDADSFDQNTNLDIYTRAEAIEESARVMALGLELRRWSALGGTLAWNRGLRFTTDVFKHTYIHDDFGNKASDALNRSEQAVKGLSFTFGPVIGFDLVLVGHLSIGVDMQPISGYYQTTTGDNSHRRVYPNRPPSVYSRDKSDFKGFGLDMVTDTRGILTLSF